MKTNNTALTLVPLSCLCVAVMACTPSGSGSGTPSNDSARARSAGSSLTATARVVAAALPISGNPLLSSTVSAKAFSAGQTQSGGPVMTYDQIIASHPVLATSASYLAGIDSVIETDAPGFDLYSGGVLQMSLSYNATTGALLVKQSTQPFAADSITYQMAAAVAPQTAAVQSVTFEMSDCIAQPTPAQDPKSKVPPVTPPPLCASTQAVLDLQQVVQQQQQQQQQSKVPAPTPVPSPVPAK